MCLFDHIHNEAAFRLSDAFDFAELVDVKLVEVFHAFGYDLESEIKFT
jgi:hypothetical protein